MMAMGNILRLATNNDPQTRYCNDKKMTTRERGKPQHSRLIATLNDDDDKREQENDDIRK